MGLVVLALLLLLPTVAGVPVGSTPDFNGRWRLDGTRSDASAYNIPGPVELAIRQSLTELHIVTSTSRGTSDITYRFVAPDTPPLSSGPNARWRGDLLVTHAVRDVNGQSVTVEQRHRLSADTREMTVESIVNVQHGYTATGAQTYGVSRDVFVRQP